jgi:hypothetical protein
MGFGNFGELGELCALAAPADDQWQGNQVYRHCVRLRDRLSSRQLGTEKFN